MNTQHQTSNPEPVMDSVDSNKSQQKSTKKKGLKPQSKKRLEKYRMSKNEITKNEIYQRELDVTSVSLDKLLSVLSSMQISAQKQEVAIPITTRGVGFLTAESYSEAISVHPKAQTQCTVSSAYRVCLAQQQLQLAQSDSKAALNDPTVEHLRYQNTTLESSLKEQIASTPQSFRLTADTINSIGKFEHHQTNFRPIVKSPNIGRPDATTPKRSRVEGDLLPDPFHVTFNNLRATVVGLADPATPEEVRIYFRDNNPLPGAIFNEAAVLTNPHAIMPAGYGVQELSRDQRQFRAMLGMIKGKSPHLVGECNFDGHGNSGQLVTTFQERGFRILNDIFKFSPGPTRFRCIRQLEPAFIIRGALGLLGEYPPDMIDHEFYGIRAAPWHEQYLDLSWGLLLGRALSR